MAAYSFWDDLLKKARCTKLKTASKKLEVLEAALIAEIRQQKMQGIDGHMYFRQLPAMEIYKHQQEEHMQDCPLCYLYHVIRTGRDEPEHTLRAAKLIIRQTIKESAQEEKYAAAK